MHPRLSLLGLILFLVGGWGTPWNMWAAEAIDIGAMLNSAQQAVAVHDYARALNALVAALDQVRLAAPLTVEPALLVTEPAKFYGGYTPRTDAVLQRGEALHVYLEPKNLVYPRTAQGTYEPAFSIDLQILAPDETVLATQERFGFFRFVAKSPLQDIFVNLQVTLTGAPAGDYKIRFLVRDANSEKTATVTHLITLK